MSRPLVVAITGASGAPYAVRLLEVLLSAGREVHLSISPAGAAVIKQELERDVDLQAFRLEDLLGETPHVRQTSPPAKGVVRATGDLLHYHFYQDLMAPIASGSFLTAGMVVCPCSGSTLSAVAHASGGNLIHRAADVHLKERRKLVLVPRETPLSLPQVDNLRRCAEAGAVVLPAMPGFYHNPQSIGDLVDFVVARICDQLEVEHELMNRWGEEKHEIRNPKSEGIPNVETRK